jgi:hypothetical protein
VLTSIAGVAAGCLGALLGIGGGVLLVPLLHAVLGMTFRQAAAVSLVGVLATSSSVAGAAARERPTNVHLAVVLLVFSVLGATVGAEFIDRLPDRSAELTFGLTAAVIAAVMFARLDRRNVIRDVGIELGTLGGRFYDEDTGEHVAYRLRRPGFAMLVAFGAGVLASFVGIGGGILIVPALNSWCGVPMRVAAATSAFMIGVTAIPGVVASYAGGHMQALELPAAAALGALVGYRFGLWIGSRAPVRGLKLLMAGILSLVAVEYLIIK